MTRNIGRPTDGKLIKRPQEQVDEILSKVSNTVVLKNFMSRSDRNILLDIYHNNKNRDHKNTGPTTLIAREFKDDPKFTKIFNKIQTKLELKLKVWGGNFFETETPYVIHNDVDYRHDIIPAKCIVIPLQKFYMENSVVNDKDAQFYIFDQMFFHAPVKCFKNAKDIKNFYNWPLYDYTDVYGLHKDNRKPDINISHFDEKYPQWCEGFSVESACNWVPGDVIVFDCVRLHCASNFLDNGVSKKIGLSLFTSFDK